MASIIQAAMTELGERITKEFRSLIASSDFSLRLIAYPDDPTNVSLQLWKSKPMMMRHETLATTSLPLAAEEEMIRVESRKMVTEHCF